VKRSVSALQEFDLMTRGDASRANNDNVSIPRGGEEEVMLME